MADPSHDMAAPPLLATFGGCDGPLFADGTKPQDLSTQTAFDSAWTTNWAKPQIKEGALTFGPHPLTADWWDNYSPTATVTKPGDVLICARMRLMSQQNDPAGDNSFELTMRNPDAAMYETSGMVLLIEGNASQVGLRTRTGADTWVRYARAPLRMESGNQTTFDLLLYGQGSRFVAEVKNHNTGEIVRMRGDAPLPAGGAVTMVGWRSRNGIFVDKLIFGAPSVQAGEQLMTALSPLP